MDFVQHSINWSKGEIFEATFIALFGLITIVAGYLGLFLGVLLLEGANRLLVAAGAELQFFNRPEIDLRVALAALAVLVGSGALAGLMPAVQAARVKPAEALRSE